jgi:hypothetical protein
MLALTCYSRLIQTSRPKHASHQDNYGSTIVTDHYTCNHSKKGGQPSSQMIETAKAAVAHQTAQYLFLPQQIVARGLASVHKRLTADFGFI